MVEDTAVIEDNEEHTDNQGKRNDENNGMPARSINVYLMILQ